MSPIQQMLLGVGAVATKTYVDDIFSTYLWEGTGSARSINTGVDMTEGGLTWIRRRNQATDHYLYDTASGATKYLASNDNMAQQTDTATLTAFNNNGFSLGTNGGVNGNGNDFVGWTFRKAPGFFDVVSYTGNGSNRTISHSLGSVPGCIMVKDTSSSNNWAVYHAAPDNAENYGLSLNSSDAIEDNDGYWNDTKPTSTQISLGTNARVNGNGNTYVAYVFAGGESTAGNARSGVFSGTNDRLYMDGGSDFQFGTGDFTIECWAKPDTITQSGVFQLSAATGGLHTGGIAAALGGDNKWKLGYGNLTQLSGGSATKGQWHHLAYVRHSGVSKLYINGTAEISVSDTTNYTYDNLVVGGYYSTSYLFDGCISNLRVVKGTAVYTSSFKPPTEPLANITGTVLLAVGVDSNIVDRTVSPTTWNIEGNPGIDSTNSPFDDPAGFVFGDAGDQNVIKTGSYVGTGNPGIEVNIGFEPQLILIKSTANGENWEIYDSMRGIVDGGADRRLRVNTSAAEDDNPGFFSLRPNGFIVNGTSGSVNTDGVTFVFLALRRPDGYVGKPPELGTGVFNIVNQATDGVAPFYRNIGFPVDFALFKKKNDGSHNWGASPRLTQGYYLSTNQNRAESANSAQQFDYMDAWNDGTETSGDYVSWAWKRHAGFDVVCYEGNGSSQNIPHSMNKVPEMIWTKRRDNSANWHVYHKDLGTNGWEYYLHLNTSDAEGNANVWNNTPTSSTFSLSPNGDNQTGSENIAMLFASVDGISKVGYYTGNGSTSGPTITTGFSPRFLFIKRTDGTASWFTHDTLRGFSGNGNPTPYLRLDLNNAQTSITAGYPISTGFTLTTTGSSYNANGGKYIYYAHA